MKERLILLTLVGALGVACGDRREPFRLPTVPGPTEAPTPAPPLTGKVIDTEGNAVAAAAVTFAPSTNRSVSAMTDSNGAYEIPVTNGGPSGESVTAAKDGFETNEQFWNRRNPPVQDFRLHRLVRLDPGLMWQADLTETDSLCGLDAAWRCRTVRIRPSSNGTLTLEAVGRSASEAVGLEVLPPYTCCGRSQSLPVVKDVELRVNVLVPWNGSFPRSVTLRTGFVPD
jgi:hypothetical protein